jgi:hypothetical protein
MPKVLAAWVSTTDFRWSKHCPFIHIPWGDWFAVLPYPMFPLLRTKHFAKDETTWANSWREVRPHQAMDSMLPDFPILPNDMVTTTATKGLGIISGIMVYIPKDGMP